MWLPFTGKEYDLLAYLARHQGRAVSYEELLEGVWRYPPAAGNRAVVTKCANRLRKKLGEEASRPEYVISIRGVGYRLRSQEQWEEGVKQNR